MQQSHKSDNAQGVKISQELLLKFSNETNKLIETHSYDSFEESIHNAITGWIISNDIENTQSRDRKELSFLLFDCLKHFRTCAPNIHCNVIYTEELYYFILDLGLKKRKKYFKEVRKGFLESYLADDNSLRFETLYSLDLIENYIKKIQFLNTQVN